MQRSDRWPEDYDPDGGRSTGSRRGSASLSRRSSTKEKDKKKSPVASTNATPKKAKPQNLEFVVTGKQCLKKCDRANSLPGYHRRPDKPKKPFDSPKRAPNASQSSASKSRETSLEDDMSLDLSQVSDFEDTNSKYGIKTKFTALATSTPKVKVKPRSGSLQSHQPRRQDSRDNTVCSRDSLYKTSSSASPYRYAVSTELDYSSVSPEYSGQSSTELSPRVAADLPTPRSQDLHLSSCCSTSWQDCSEAERTARRRPGAQGEWAQFWARYNSCLGAPVSRYYDQCPTPYRTENIDLADLEFSADGSLKISPDALDMSRVVRTEGLVLTARETQSAIKCAHLLAGVLGRALDRRCRERPRGDGGKEEEEVAVEEDPELELKKKTLTLDLKETNEPAPEVLDKTRETVTTQTDISLPNTKSAPKIFEKILRQLSRTSLDDSLKALEAKAMENKPEKEVEINEDKDKSEEKKEN